MPFPWGLASTTSVPLARTVEDAAILLQAIAGPDPSDPTTGSSPAPNFRAAAGIAGWKDSPFGVPTNHFWPGLEPEVERNRPGDAIMRRSKSSAENWWRVEIPWARLGQIAYGGCGRAGERRLPPRSILRERREEYVSPGADFFEQSLFIPGLAVRAGPAGAYALHPPSGEAVPKGRRNPDPNIGHRTAHHRGLSGRDEGLERLSSDSTAAFSTIGNPALQVPCGFTRAGLPVGLQISGKVGGGSA